MRILEANDLESWIDKLESRDSLSGSVESTVEDIIANVRQNKDQAVKAYTKEFDGVDVELKVTEKMIEEAYLSCEAEVISSLKSAKFNIEKYHALQVRSSNVLKEDGIELTERIRGLSAVGIYVPGGKAAYPSTVLMNAIPAKLAGVKKIVMVTPPPIKDSVLVAADLCGVDEIYCVGGAQSIAALTFGTETIPKVKKIVGPGNIYVAVAKKLVSNRVGIDMIAGPSEVLILADEKSNPDFIAADMIAQAEHDEKASSICVSTSKTLLEAVKISLDQQLETAQRRSIARESINAFGALIKVNNTSEMIDLANRIAPEHLEIMIKEDITEEIDSAGAIFLGDYAPEALGDYYAGPNHTLPTSGTAIFSSPLGVDDFIKKTSVISYTQAALERSKNIITTIAEDEGLFGHANSIKIRFKETL